MTINKAFQKLTVDLQDINSLYFGDPLTKSDIESLSDWLSEDTGTLDFPSLRVYRLYLMHCDYLPMIDDDLRDEIFAYMFSLHNVETIIKDLKLTIKMFDDPQDKNCIQVVLDLLGAFTKLKLSKLKPEFQDFGTIYISQYN